MRVLAFVLSFVTLSVFGQSLQQALYPTLVQNSYQTIGNFPDRRFHIGLPTLGNTSLSMSSSGFAINDFTASNGVVTQQSLVSLVQGMKTTEHIGVALQNELLNFGFRIKEKNYLSFNIATRFGHNMTYNKDFLVLALMGSDAANYLGSSFSLDGTSYNLYAYNEIGISFNRKINDMVAAGVRVKLLNGLMNATGEFDNMNASVNTTTGAITANSKFKARDYGISEYLFDSISDPKNTIGAGNYGIGADFGGSVNLGKIKLNASVVDLGFITWKQGRVKESKGKSFNYDGVTLSQLNIDSSLITTLKDSLLGVFDMNETREDYKTTLSSKFYLGGNMEITKNFNVDVLLSGSVFDKKFYPAATLGAGVKLGKILETKLSYTMINGSYTNVGLGFVLNFAGVQLYCLTDNLMGAINV